MLSTLTYAVRVKTTSTQSENPQPARLPQAPRRIPCRSANGAILHHPRHRQLSDNQRDAWNPLGDQPAGIPFPRIRPCMEQGLQHPKRRTVEREHARRANQIPYRLDAHAGAISSWKIRHGPTIEPEREMATAYPQHHRTSPPIPTTAGGRSGLGHTFPHHHLRQ